jgi:hypothetical protein
MVSDEQVDVAQNAYANTICFTKNPKEAMRAALEAADAAAWMPIEEAPKDKMILVEGPCLVIWLGGDWFSYISGRHLQWSPTHFRHLPEPPR